MITKEKKTERKPVEGKFWTRSERKLWATGLFLGCTVLYSCRTVTPLCVAVMAKEFDWDKTQSGSILGCFFWGYTTTQFLGGYLSDRIGGDVVVPIAACFWSLLTFWTPQFAYLSTDKYVTLHILVLSRVLLGMFQGFYMPSITSMISHFLEPQYRSFYMPIIAAGQYFGYLFPTSTAKGELHYGITFV